MSGYPEIRLPPLQRWLLFAALTIVVMTGFAWIGLGFQMDPADFTNPLRTWRHRLLVLHGVAAYALIWLAGSLFPCHQRGAWQARRNRVNGVVLAGTLLLLAVSGLALYYPPQEDCREASSLVHQGLGVALALLVPLHIRRGKRLARGRLRPSPPTIR